MKPRDLSRVEHDPAEITVESLLDHMSIACGAEMAAEDIEELKKTPSNRSRSFVLTEGGKIFVSNKDHQRIIESNQAQASSGLIGWFTAKEIALTRGDLEELLSKMKVEIPTLAYQKNTLFKKFNDLLAEKIRKFIASI